MPQPWTDRDLERQFAKAQAWLPFFRDSAERHSVPVELLLAIASHESNIENKLGDYVNGVAHAYSLMQIDIGTDLTFCRSWTPQAIQPSIERGAQILAEKRDYLASRGLPASLKAIAAAYNTGQGNVARSLLDGLDPDRTTTGGNYGRDVLARMEVFARLLGQQTVIANL